MRPHAGVRVTSLVLAGLATAVVAWLGLRLALGPGNVANPTWIGVVVMAFLGGALVVAGWQVKQVRDGSADRPMTPLRAARTLVLGQAGALTGAVLAGWYAANVLALVPDSDVDSQRVRMWILAAHVVVAALLAAAGMLVQRWCRVGRRDDDDELDGG